MTMSPRPATASTRAAVRVGGRAALGRGSTCRRAGRVRRVLGPNGVGQVDADQGRPRAAAADAGGATRARPAAWPGRRPDRLPAAAAHFRRRSCGSAGVDVVRLGLDGARWGVPLPGGRRFSARARGAAARVEEVIELVGAERLRLAADRRALRRRAAAAADRPGAGAATRGCCCWTSRSTASTCPTRPPSPSWSSGSRGARGWRSCWSPTTSTRSSATSTGSSTSPGGAAVTGRRREVIRRRDV